MSHGNARRQANDRERDRERRSESHGSEIGEVALRAIDHAVIDELGRLPTNAG
jgi:hypothetical protein